MPGRRATPTRWSTSPSWPIVGTRRRGTRRRAAAPRARPPPRDGARMSERAPRKGGSAGAGRSQRPARGPARPRLLLSLLAIAVVALAIRLVYLAGAAQSPLYLHPA